ncbi:ABC transporter ATP-binding protein [Finegoldia magna]|uniref:ABC transporter ATP-binding protein n=1 Tax=Finegoldia magna TaxID=1260 RepID=UPI0020B7F495|nr:ABC transporter ATP-binding protein [Finegoldia magna]
MFCDEWRRTSDGSNSQSLNIRSKLNHIDEPESGLDFKNQLKIISLIKKLSKVDNISVIINTHYPAHALEISDKCLMLMGNAKHKIGKTSDIICKENMKEAFGVEVILEKIKNMRKNMRL